MKSILTRSQPKKERIISKDTVGLCLILRRHKIKLSEKEIGEIIYMALSDDVSFDSIKDRFDIDSDTIKRVMKQNISFSSYKVWRERVKKFSQRRQFYK